jgi:hypothetical protein
MRMVPSLLALACTLASAPALKVVGDPSGNTQYSVPNGWEVNATKPPGAASSPSVAILAMPDDPKAGGRELIAILESLATDLEITRAEPARAFLLGLCPQARHLVLHGHPFEYSVSSETNEAGED